MAMKDLESSLKASTALDIAAISSDTTTDGNAIDMQGFESVMAAYHSGAYTDGTYTPLVLEGDTNVVGAATAVADADLLPSGTGQEASAAISAANTTTKLGTEALSVMYSLALYLQALLLVLLLEQLLYKDTHLKCLFLKQIISMVLY